MWRSCFLATSLTLVFWSALSAIAQSPPRAPTLLSRVGGLPCQVVMGRVVLADQRVLAGRSDTFEDPGAGCRETLCIQSTGSQQTVRYERHESNETFVVDFLGQGDLHLRRELRSAAGATTIRFAQPLRGALTLEVADAKQTQKYSAMTLWHLVLTQPQACRDCLLPMLDQLRPDWHFATHVEAVEHALHNAANIHQPVDSVALRKQIDQLASPKFALRQQADRALRAQGLSLLPELEQLNRQSLDAEQRRRLDDLRALLTAKTPDTPERVAAWLVADRNLWKQLTDAPQSVSTRD